MKVNLPNSISIKQVDMVGRISASPVSIKNMVLKSQVNLGMKPLRTCRECGKKIYTENDLTLFVKHKRSSFGVANLCKECYGRIYDDRRITIHDKQIRVKENPRHNVCTICGKTKEENGGIQLSMHHHIYDLDKPLENTQEMCISCHNRQRRAMLYDINILDNFFHI